MPPVFRFHPNAYDLGVFEAVEGTCEACMSRRTLRYTSSFYSIEEVNYICPWCVADGTAARVFDGHFSSYTAIDGIPSDPGLPATVDVAEAMEVATRTPSYSSWQQEEWRSHCGRPCAFIGDIGSSDLGQYLHEPDFAADVNGGLRWDPAVLRRYLVAGGELAGYLFRCLSCGAHRLHVDAS
ncbi:CbrC family protein [Glaciihabitans tibetensis]|uniref:CbrC family protein n=1 Tax=Glaciihabitans tibetensis TaxID=1266600 RepID=UPI0015E7ADFF|nr:CbrC family protein [Glaciihabitans tibetensis]